MGHAFAKLLWITNESGSNKAEKKDSMPIHGNGGIILLIRIGEFRFKSLNLVDMFHLAIAMHRRQIMAFGFKSQTANLSIRDADYFDLLFSYILLA